MVVQEAHKGPSRQVALQGLEQLLRISELFSAEDSSQPLDATTKYERYPPANVGVTKSVGGGALAGSYYVIYFTCRSWQHQLALLFGGSNHLQSTLICTLNPNP